MTEAELEAIKKEIQDDASQDVGGDDDDESYVLTLS